MHRVARIDAELPARVIVGAELPAIPDAHIRTDLDAAHVDTELRERERCPQPEPGLVVHLIDEHRIEAKAERRAHGEQLHARDDAERDREAPVVLARAPHLEARHEAE